MSVPTALYQSTLAAGRGLRAAFNFVTGNTALDKRNLYRSCNEFGYTPHVVPVGTVLAIIGGAVAGGVLAPVVGPLAIAFAAAAVATGAIAPAVAEAVYKIGEYDLHRKKKSLKVAK